ncbi:Sodium hydrogen exchanger 3, partial [Globisporangium splendens]
MLARQCRKAQALGASALKQQQQLRWASSAGVSSSEATTAAAAANARQGGGASEESNFSRYAGMAFFSTILLRDSAGILSYNVLMGGVCICGVKVAGTAYLGVWQTQRYYWKVDLIEERTRELHEAAVDLPKDATARSSVDDIEYRQLRVEGKYKPDSTYYLYPRSAPAESTDSVAAVKSGGYLYSLLERDNSTPVIVNRGWLPRKLLDQHIAGSHKEEDGEVLIVGVLRHGEEKGKFTPDNDVTNRQFFYLQHEELARAMGVEGDDLPIIVDALAIEGDTAEASLTHPLRKRIENYTEFYMSPEKHAGYAATWYSFGHKTSHAFFEGAGALTARVCVSLSHRYSFSIAAAVMAYLRFKKGKVESLAEVERSPMVAMANGVPAFPSPSSASAATASPAPSSAAETASLVLNSQAMGVAQQLQLQQTGGSQIGSNEFVALQAKQQRMRLQQANGGAGSQLQQRAAQAAQFLSAERKMTSREIQTMLEKNEAALRAWNALHTQEPLDFMDLVSFVNNAYCTAPKALIKEHKEWIRKCMTLRQQIGARLEVLASLADKQIAIEDENSEQVKQQKQEPQHLQQNRQPAAKKTKTAQARQVATQQPKPSPPSRATVSPAPESATNDVLLTTPPAPVPSPTSFPDPPMPMVSPDNAQQFGYPGAEANGVFYGSGQSAAMTSTTGFANAAVSSTNTAAVASSQSFPMSDAQSFAANAYMNSPNPATNAAANAMFINQQQNYMMNPGAMNMAMMNPQYLAMQMQMQNQLPMNMGAPANMYNPAMFNNYVGMGTNQLPADPFNASFNQPVFPAQGAFNPVTGGFDAMAGMQATPMMNGMNAFQMMPDPMMMNSFPYGMNMVPQQQQVQPQQQFQNQQQQQPTTTQAFPPVAPQQQQQLDQQANAFTDTSIFDDAAASNLFDGFPEDAFLQM